MDLAGVGGLLVGAAAVVGAIWKVRSTKHEEKKADKAEVLNRRQDLQSFVTAQTEALLKGYEGVFDEYKRQAQGLLEQLKEAQERLAEALRVRDALTRRVGELEEQVKTLTGRIEELQRELGRAR